MRTKTTSVIVGMIVLGLLMGIVGCAQPSATPTPKPTQTATPTPTATYKPPQQVGIAVGTVGSIGYALISAIAPMIEKYVGAPTRAIPQESVASLLGAVRQGTALVSTGYNINSLSEAVMADAAFANGDWGPQPLRVVWRAYNVSSAIMVRGDSSIKKLEDIKGKKIAYWVGGRLVVEGMLNWLGLTRNDLQFVDVSSMAALTKAITEGRADFGWSDPAQPTAVEAAENPQGIRWINFPLENKAGWQKFIEKAPMASPGTNVRGVKSAYGIETPQFIVVMTAYPGADPELTYRLAKFFAEAYPQYKDLASGLEDYSTDQMRQFLDKSPYPVDPGAVKYLKEKGLWTDKDDPWNKQWLDLEDKYGAAWAAATKEATAKNIKTDYTNKPWTDLWNSYRKDLPTFKVRL